MPKAVLTQITSNLSEILVYAAIALVTLVGFCKCIFPLIRNSAILNRAISRLERTTTAGEVPAWRESRFLGRALRAEWKQFLFNASQLDLRGMPCDTRDYINEETVIDKPGHTQLAELIPGLLTSLGILGTFMGLMQGLSSVDFGNAQSTIDSIPRLLAGMKFAFATSVAGISCSLIFNMINRMAIGKALRSLDRFETAFYELAMPRPLETDVALLCRQQDEDARNARLAESIGNHIAASVESAVTRSIAPLTQSMNSFMQSATQEQIDGVRRIVGQFIQQMNIALNGQMSALGDTMNMVNDASRQNQQDLHTAMNAVAGLTQDAETLHASAYDTLQAMDRLTASVNNTLEERHQAAAESDQAIAALTDELTQLTVSLNRLRQLTDSACNEAQAASRRDQ